MLRSICKSKIHRAIVTEADLEYEGSITIDLTLMKAADILQYEEVWIYDITNGNRLQTYVIEGEADSGVIGINGAAARHISPGDLVIIAGYSVMETEEAMDFVPKHILVDENNRVVRELIQGRNYIEKVKAVT
ncbi:MAG: aspartate 1-decarboxylase [Deltaproteobacteria bacterium]|uniref:Aspartate 1-decarboxylase n=1 Tax=Candidatus Zymogenus saltonus TaxID=2844893 RepID=A0A9D8KFU0_9DELT|nr:aspartate 1-decarboxylase [Candidatus Zymogenus saltonus]